MRHLLQVAILAILLQASAHVLAQPSKVLAPPTTASAAQPVASDPEPSELVAAKQQIKMLESQIQMTREYQGSLLDTVYWALGGVFLVISLILGFGWFANFKVYERDKESLRSELAASALKTSSELEQSVKAQTKTISDNLSKSLKALVSEELKPSAASIASIERRLFELELTRLKNKMEVNPSDNMALTDALNLLELCQKRAQDEVPDIMHFMLKKIDKGGRLTANEITRVNAVIDVLPPHYKALTDKVRAKLVASDIF